jgi:DNA invertase Pin-like site-specific DNA recombinase
MSNYFAPPKKLDPGSVVWAYVRDSGGEAQEQSVPQQIEVIQEFCIHYRLNLAHVFKDVAKSGGSVAGREAFLDMVDMSNHAEWRPKGLIIWNFARFGRDMIDAMFYKALLRRRDIVIHSLTDQIPEGAQGLVFETMLDYANQEKREQTSRDTKRGLRFITREGYACGGFPPRGYKAVKEAPFGKKRDGNDREVSRWVPDPELWELVKLAWLMRAEGKTYAEIQKATERKIYRSDNCWATFFRNKTYLGIGKCGDLEVPDHHEAVIDQEVWDRVQEVQKGHPKFGQVGHPNNPRRVGSPSLLSGLAVCIHCGSAVVHKKTNLNKGNAWPYYVCGRKEREEYKSCEGRMINAKQAEQVIMDKITFRVLTPDYFQALLSEVRARLCDTASLDQEEKALNRKLAEVNRNIDNLLDLAEHFGALAAVERLKERELERGQVLRDIQEVKSKRAMATLDVSPEALAVAFDAWRGQLEGLRQGEDTRGLRNFLSRFVSKVELGYNRAVIWYTYPISNTLDDTVPGWGHRLQEPLYR